MSRARRPKLGQHFLQDIALCQKIAHSLAICPDDLVIEIGAGEGAMTRLLAARALRLIAIEVDPSLAARLESEFSGTANVQILQQDILKVDLRAMITSREAASCYVFGNLPYYITSPILRHLFSAHASIRHMTLMMQREVAERVVAQPGSRAYGVLSVLAQCWSQPEFSLAVPRGAFSPVPSVDSLLVDFAMSARFPAWDEGTHKVFLRFIQRGFRLKRKTLLNNLSLEYGRLRTERALKTRGLDARARAERLSVDQFAELFYELNR
jgi:16S rRNA (adenine1518-N6/adenine1519-N6)-dimethyltransferase